MRRRPGGWVALAWRYYRDPKFDDVSADAELLWTRALAYCGEQATDGRLARSILVALSPRLAGSAEAAAGELVAVGLWHEVGRGYLVNGWRRWQPSPEETRQERERDAKRKAVARSNADNARDNGRDIAPDIAGTSRGEGEGEGGGLSPTPPDPQRLTIVASQDQDPDTWVDEHGYLFVGRPPDENGAP